MNAHTDRPWSRSLFRWGICVVYTILLTTLSLISPPRVGVPPIPHIDKVGHFVAYGIYAWLLLWAIGVERRRVWAWAVGVAVFCTLYGVAMEFLQGALKAATRSFSVADMVANTLGAAVVAAGACRLRSNMAGRWQVRAE